MCEWSEDQHDPKAFLTKRTGCGSSLSASWVFAATARFPLTHRRPWHFSGTYERWITGHKKRQCPAVLKIYCRPARTGPYVKEGRRGPFLQQQSNTSQLELFSLSNTWFNLMGSRQTCLTAVQQIFKAFYVTFFFFKLVMGWLIYFI